MSLHRRAAKRDGTEKAIVAALRAHGCIVWEVSGTGIPDLIVLRKGKKWLADTKSKTGKATPAQEKKWEEAATKAQCAVFILRTPEDATKMLNDALPAWEPIRPKARLADVEQATRNSKAAPPHSCKNCEGIQPETCLVNPHRSPPKGDAAKARAEGRKRIGGHAVAASAFYIPPLSTPVDAAKEAEVFAPPETGDRACCLYGGKDGAHASWCVKGPLSP